MEKKQIGAAPSVPKRKKADPTPGQYKKVAVTPPNSNIKDTTRTNNADYAKVYDMEDDLFHTLEFHVKEAKSIPKKENVPKHDSNKDNVKSGPIHVNNDYQEAAKRIKAQSKVNDTIREQKNPLEEPPKQKFMTGLWAILLGYTGIHWFYQKKYLRGAAYLAVFFFLSNFNESSINPFVIFCFTEGVFIIASSSNAFRRYYHKHMKTIAFWCCLVISIAVFCWLEPASTSVAEHNENITPLAVAETEFLESSSQQQFAIETKPSVSSSEPQITISNTEEVVPFNSVAGNALASVMMGKNNFTMAETGTHQSLFNMTEFMQFTFENYLMPTSFCVVDMDQDGTNEIIVGIDTDVDGFRLVLRYEYGTVYGYPFGFRGLKTVSTDGLITASSSAFESPTIRLSFSGLSIDYYNLSYAEEQTALASWQDATWYEFTEENVGKFFPNMNISFALPSAPPPSSADQENESFETYINGYVKYGTAELRIRSGPGTEYEDIGRLREGAQVVILEIAHSGNREWGRTDRGWVCMDYIQEGEPSASYIDTSSMYALDYIDGTTGDVLNRIGRNYIIGSGFSGSTLFYYGSNTNIQFGFVPYDWTNPSISGNEPISVILVGGNARISQSLSADMNKAQLDAAAWNTPDVVNVSGQYTYGEMWGNVYMYEIETTSARILYMWYLDNGDNIDYPAGEVTISPK